jgi:hypothetical protein
VKRLALVLATLLLCQPTRLSAHDVPDRVDIAILIKAEHDRLRILARVPANALIDFLLPTQDYGNWVDLTNADVLATEAARVWVAEMLSLRENGAALPTPRLLKVHLSRVNDPSFLTYDGALARVNGPPLAPGTLVLQEQVTVDALLEVPIRSPAADIRFRPRFGRLGVLVYTTLTYLPPDGRSQRFYYEGDPPEFSLNPTTGDSARRFFSAGLWHVLGETDYLMFALCIAMAFTRVKSLAAFAALVAGAELCALLAARLWLPAAPWTPVLCGALLAAVTVCAGIEAIVSARSERRGFAVVVGAVFGAAFWSALQPVVQFGGAHTLAAALAFACGLVATQLSALAVAALVVFLIARVSRVPRGITIVVAALVVHVSWQQMLDHVHALTLVGLPLTTRQLALSAALAAVIIVAVSWGRRPAARALRQPEYPAARLPAR